MKTFFALTTGLFAGAFVGFCMGAYCAQIGYDKEEEFKKKFMEEQLKENSKQEV